MLFTSSAFRMFQANNLPTPFLAKDFKKKKERKKSDTVFCSTSTKYVVACLCCREGRLGPILAFREMKELRRAALLTPHRRPTWTCWLQSGAAGGGKGLIGACLPQCQVHLAFPTGSGEGSPIASLLMPGNPTWKTTHWHATENRFWPVAPFIAKEEDERGGSWGGKK